MKLSSSLLTDMVKHWLSTPVGTYVGSNYGNNANELLQLPLGAVSSSAADSFIAKLRADVPVLQQLPPNSIELFSVNSFPDASKIVLSIRGETFEVTT